MPDFSLPAEVANGCRQDVWLDQDGKTVIYTEQDVEPILEYAQAMRNGQFSTGDDFGRLEYEIPWVLAMEWRKQGLDVFNPVHFALLERKLRDIEFSKLRTAPKVHPNIRVKGTR